MSLAEKRQGCQELFTHRCQEQVRLTSGFQTAEEGKRDGSKEQSGCIKSEKVGYACSRWCKRYCREQNQAKCNATAVDPALCAAEMAGRNSRLKPHLGCNPPQILEGAQRQEQSDDGRQRRQRGGEEAKCGERQTGELNDL